MNMVGDTMEAIGDANLLWSRALLDIKSAVSELVYVTWIEPAKPCLGQNKDFVLKVPNEMSKDYLEGYKELIQNALALVSSQQFNVEVEVATPEVKLEPTVKPEAVIKKDEPFTNGRNRLNPAYSFDTYVVGPNNRFAYAACVAVAEMKDSKNYNPLFLYGGSGVGKTHLMQAIGNYVRKNNPEKNVMYVQSEQFVNEFIQVIASKKYDAFRNKYRMVDLLLIDDIQFIENKEQMQEEFFHTFNSLFEAGKNIVLTCDKPAQSLTTLEDRLRTRISSGLTIDITPPDYETRMAILAQLANTHGVLLPNNVMDYVASNVTSNIRELEGAFKTLIAFSMLGNDLSLENTEIALKDIVQPAARKKVDEHFIMNVCANYYEVTVDDLKSKKRKRELVEPRHIAMYLCYELIDMTYTDIGDVFGGRNHATVIHACNKVEEDMKADAKIARIVKEISSRLNI